MVGTQAGASLDESIYDSTNRRFVERLVGVVDRFPLKADQPLAEAPNRWLAALFTMTKSLPSIFLLVLVVPMTLWSQDQRFALLDGVVVDRTTRLPIENVNISFREFPKGTVTDRSGRFTLRIPLGRSIQLIFSHISYDKLTKNYRFDRPDTLVLEMSLQPRVIQSGEVTVTAKKPFAELRAKYTLSGVEVQQCGEKDMEHKLRYLIPTIVKPYETRMLRPSQDFTLYVNGKWIESDFLNDIDPATVKRVLVWGGLGNEPPVGFSIIRGSYVVSIETQ